MGRKTWERVNYGPFSQEFSYSYYGNGLKQTFTASDNTVYTYLYGLNNELQEVQIPSVGSITIPTYTWNRPATVNYPGGTQRTYTYDALMRLQALTVLDPSSTSLLDDAYTYDEVGNILTKTTEHGTYTYGYDTVSRLLSADNPVLDDESYTYDDVGNRLTSADVSGSWSYNTNNELLDYTDVEYNYDDNGNLTQIAIVGAVVWTYVYDAANRLVHVEDGTGSITADYSYDPFGRRLWKDVGGTRTYFFYSEEGLIAEYDASGVEIRSYGYKPDSTWTTDPLWLKEGGTYYWYQNDHLGTPQKLTAQDGTVVWSAQYTAFGEADVQVETVTNNLRMPGMYEDEETGLYYNYHRYYDPKIGRYLRVDPIGFWGRDVNLYGYVQSNPLYRIDPVGLGSWTAVEEGELFYTWHMGWIDTSHAYRNTKSLIGAWKRIEQADIAELVPFTLDAKGVLVSVEADFCLIVADGKRDRKQQLLHAWMVFSEHFEKAQGKWFFDWEWINEVGGLLLKGNVGQTPSSFSTEDVISNLVYFYAVVDADYSLVKGDKNEQDVVYDMAEQLVNDHAGRFYQGGDERIISQAIWLFSLKAEPGRKNWEQPQYFNHKEFLTFDFSGNTIWYQTEIMLGPGGLSTMLGSGGPFPHDVSLPREYYEIGAKAQQLLPKYIKEYGEHHFPGEFRRYHPMSEGYIYTVLR